MRWSSSKRIRRDHCIGGRKNLIHGSDSVESAKRELSLWFPEAASDDKIMTEAADEFTSDLINDVVNDVFDQDVKNSV